MAKITEIVIDLNGKEMRLTYKDAEQLYNVLKYLFETRVITVPQIQPMPNNPYGPPIYYSNQTTAVD